MAAVVHLHVVSTQPGQLGKLVVPIGEIGLPSGRPIRYTSNMYSSRPEIVEAPADALNRQFADGLVPPPPFWDDWLDPDEWQVPPDDGRDAQWPPAGLL